MTGLPPYMRRHDKDIFNTVNKAYIRKRWIEYSMGRKRKCSRDYLKVFTLSGVDCRDVRCFLENGLLKVGKTGFEEDTLTFCENITERYVLIKNALPGARSYKGDYKDFIGKRSIGFSSKADDFFPFDIINLDFTGPGFSHSNYGTSNTMNSIRKTLEAQKGKRQSFTLFLTLTAEKHLDNEQGIRALNRCISENNRSYVDFKDAYDSRFPEGDYKSYQDYIHLGVSKIIIKWGAENSFDVILKECLTYIGGGQNNNRMMCFIFDCEYVGLPNSYEGTPPPIDEIYLSRIITILENDLIDVDTLISSDSSLKNELKEERQREPYRFKST